MMDAGFVLTVGPSGQKERRKHESSIEIFG